MTGLAHDGFHSFAAVEHGGNVQVHNLLEILRIVLAERRTGGDTGVIHQNIRAAEGVCHLLYGILHRRKVRQVRPQAHNLPLVIFRFQSGPELSPRFPDGCRKERPWLRFGETPAR